MRSILLVAVAVAVAVGGFAAGAGGAERISTAALLPLQEAKDAYTPAAAFGKDVFLVVWQSGRMGKGSLVNGLIYDGDLVACRVDKGGKALDARPFVVCGARDLQERPKVAFGPSTGSGQGNGVFLVVWQDIRNGKDWDIYAARVTPEGKVLDPEGIAVSAIPHNQADPRVAWDGKAFQVVWEDFRSGTTYEIYGARVSSEGKVLDPDGICLAKNRFPCFTPAICPLGGGKVFLLWFYRGDGGRGTCSCIVADGRVIDDKAYVYAEDFRKHGPVLESNPVALAGGPNGFMATWLTDAGTGRGGPPNGSTAAVFDSACQRKKSLFLAGKRHTTRQTDVVWDGSAYAAAWIERIARPGMEGRRWALSDMVFAARITEAGDPAGEVLSVAGSHEAPASRPAVASDGAGTTLIAYEQHPAAGDVPIKIGFRMLRAK